MDPEYEGTIMTPNIVVDLLCIDNDCEFRSNSGWNSKIRYDSSQIQIDQNQVGLGQFGQFQCFVHCEPCPKTTLNTAQMPAKGRRPPQEVVKWWCGTWFNLLCGFYHPSHNLIVLGVGVYDDLSHLSY